MKGKWETMDDGLSASGVCYIGDFDSLIVSYKRTKIMGP
jgi:hypothetical protein